MTLGSLFDGIGGFPYAASFFGIKTLWASDIMPQAISVTKRHFPDMTHVGDITELDGGTLPPIDIITFGSPCQGLSAAGRRRGLADPRSGLFTEAIRIIYEMRAATNGRYPTWAVWENVPGALSSNGGADFKAVLEAFTAREIPFPKSGRWAKAGMVRGAGADLAWCVYNAQYFGVAQRRRRIFLVADFGAERAGEILFVPKSLRRYFETRGAPRQIAPPDALRGADSAIEVLNDQGGSSLDIERSDCSPTLRSQTHGNLPVVAKPVNCLTPWDTQQSRVFTDDGASPTLAGADGGGGRNPAGLVLQHEEVYDTASSPVAAFCGNAGGKARSIGYDEELSPTLKSSAPYLCEPINHKAVGVHQNQCGDVNTSTTAYTLSTSSNASARNAPLVAHRVSSVAHEVHPQTVGTLCASGAGLSRPAGMASETDLCIVIPDSEPIPIHDKATRYSGGGGTRKDDGAGNGLGVGKSGDPAPTLTSGDKHMIAFNRQRSDAFLEQDIAGTQAARQCKDATDLVCEEHPVNACCLQGTVINRQHRNGPNGTGVNAETSFTLMATDQHAVAAVDCRNYKEVDNLSGTLQAKNTPGYSLNFQNPVRTGYIVRRLTPTECERLQGFPNGWTAFGHDGKLISDTARYMMLGNSVAVPCVVYIMMGIAAAHKNGLEAN